MTDRPDITILCAGTDKTGFPHHQALIRSNPTAHVEFSTVRHGNLPDGRSGHTNSDVFIRDWWRNNGDKVTTDGIFYMEYDTLCNMPVRSMIHQGVTGVLAANLLFQSSEPWYPFWPMLQRLPAFLPRDAGALVPTFFYATKAAMDAFADSLYDDAFAVDVNVEVRMPAVFAHAGFAISRFLTPGISRLVGNDSRVKFENCIIHPMKTVDYL